MNDALLGGDITSWLVAHACGAANAKPRRMLLDYLRSVGHSIDDRGMRKRYEDMERVGSCGRGLFWILTPEDRRIAQGQLIAPAASMFAREKRIKDTGAMGAQGELF